MTQLVEPPFPVVPLRSVSRVRALVKPIRIRGQHGGPGVGGPPRGVNQHTNKGTSLRIGNTHE
eukprot:6457264-Pyramimonas_sp.AAC.1